MIGESNFDYYIKTDSNDQARNFLRKIENETDLVWGNNYNNMSISSHDIFTEKDFDRKLNITHLLISKAQIPNNNQQYYLYYYTDNWKFSILGDIGREAASIEGFIELYNTCLSNKSEQFETKTKLDKSMWNTKCPICKSDAYQGIGSIECSKGCY